MSDNLEESTAGGLQNESLTGGERALAKAFYSTTFEEMDDWQQSQFRRLLEDLPKHMRAGLDGQLLTKDQLSEGMEDAFITMTEDDDLPEEWKDGAAVFAKSLQKKFGLDGGPE